MHILSAKQLRDAFIEGSFSAQQICCYFLDRIEKLDPQVGAFLAIYRERSLEQAKNLDEKRNLGAPCGKLAAIPIALKDNLHVEGEVTTCGSKFLTNYRAVFNATVTNLIEEADGIIIGKTNLDEFAMGSSTEHSALRKTVNPWHSECVPGGSSGGSAAAVAARLCPIALGTDTGGSIRQPAAFCGVVGMKPTYGRVSRYGLVAFGSSLDQIGPIATTTEDIGLMMEVIGQHDPSDATSLPIHGGDYIKELVKSDIRGKKLGVPYNFLTNLAPEARENFDASLKIFENLGAKLVPVDLDILKYSVATYYILATAEASTNLARFDGIRYGIRSKNAKTLDEVYDYSRRDGFGWEVKKRILLGTYVLSSGYQDAYYNRATKVRVKIIDAFLKAFEGCEAIVSPTTPTPCFPRGAIQDPVQMYLQDLYTIGANLARLPAISIPSGFNKEGKPWSVQMIGASKEDVRILEYAQAFERAVPFFSSIPKGFE
ncbi:MAG: Asp-tRNA(Asn)/Glu-tRNA(Gln) amidotransferase subunit GatA [Chlamydiia bacterium]|nr:Asp-tRNA(Asn)/Glu-tRNA(Gln) amidotransferase subunit GatA [Chlamydiia bacterium]